MLILKIALFVVPLGLDTFAIAIALGLRGIRPLRPAVTFAIFEAIMPLVGLFVGHIVGDRFETAASIVGGLVLVTVALFLGKEALEDEDETANVSFDSLRTAALAGFGISLDEAAIGFPMGTSGLPVPQTLAAIAVQAFVVTLVGITLGKRLGERFGATTSRTAGLIAAAAFGLLGTYLIVQRFVPSLPAI